RKLRINRKKSKGNPEGPRTYILAGGALAARGDAVQPGALSAVVMPAPVTTGDPPKSDPAAITNARDHRRLQLARWITSRDNGLAMRSIVNRVWQYHFGVGIAANSNNFGAKGAPPSHPQLLDFLAADFADNGWTFKRLHRAIMMSDAYKRSAIAADPESLAIKDPNNQLLSFFPRRRLTAEELRDATLQITGELIDQQGGLPVNPEINLEVALQPRMIQFSLAPAYQFSPTPQQRNRRTIYAYQVRGQSDPFNDLFNQPNPNESCEMRETAAVTPQVFTLLNSDIMQDRSIALALRLQSEHKEIDDQINNAFRLVLGRDATQAQRGRLARYIADMSRYHEEHPARTPQYPTSITRSLVEEFTGEPFEYTEILPTYENYQMDRKPADVAPKTRALADMCLLLLNSNEFMYLN
ncbi:MAG: DUF1553 domain-containing protein, partial [Planctomycetota bacterium]